MTSQDLPFPLLFPPSILLVKRVRGSHPLIGLLPPTGLVRLIHHLVVRVHVQLFLELAGICQVPSLVLLDIQLLFEVLFLKEHDLFEVSRLRFFFLLLEQGRIHAPGILCLEIFTGFGEVRSTLALFERHGLLLSE